MNLRFVRSSFLACASVAILTLAGCTDDEKPLAQPSCTDGIKNGVETDVDCGGADCDACALDKTCAAGTDCASGLCGADSTCVECVEAATCPAPDASLDPECAAAACNAEGRCEVAFTAAGTAVAAQTAGDCHQVECDGAGMVADNALDTDVPVDDDPCTADVCTDGVASNPFALFGTDCGTDGVCDGEGSCLAVGGEIEAVLATAATGDTTGLSLPITSALVTYVRSESLGSDLAGFFVQAHATGPALFVETDVSAMIPPPVVGDMVGFTVTAVATAPSGGIVRVTGIADFTVITQGNDASGLVQDVTEATDLVSAVDDYFAELIHVTGTLATGPGWGGSGFLKFGFATTGLPTDGLPSFRAPSTLIDDMDLVQGCTVTADAVPLWKYNADAQVTAWKPGDITDVTGCPAPVLGSVEATAIDTVVLSFDRHLDPASVAADGSQFTFDNGLQATAAVVSGRTITLTTGDMSAIVYYVDVPATVTDTYGAPVEASHTGFFGYGSCRNPLVMSQVYGGGGNSGAPYTNDYVELHNREALPVSLAGWSIQYASAAGSTWTVNALSGTIPAGGFFLVQLAAGSNTSGLSLPLPAPDLDLSSGSNLAAANGKVALVKGTTALSGTCPSDSTIVDFVGFGTASCSETLAAPAMSNTTSIFRLDTTEGATLACIDTQDNSIDFVTGEPAPRNGSTTGVVCACTP